MRTIRALILVFCLVQASYGAQPELESVFLGRYFSDATLSPGRITLTTGVRVNFVKEGEPSRLLEAGETISLTPGFSEVYFAERHSWLMIRRIGHGNLYELTSAFDFRSFGKELEEKKSAVDYYCRADRDGAGHAVVIVRPKGSGYYLVA